MDKGSAYSILIGSETYYYEQGMTWEQWISSKYNVNNFIIDGESIKEYVGSDKKLLYGDLSRWVFVSDIVGDYDSYFFYKGSLPG